MGLADYLITGLSGNYSLNDGNNRSGSDFSLNEFIQTPTKVLSSKQEVLSSLIFQRLILKEKNLKPLNKERFDLENFLQRFSKWITGEEFREYRDQLFEVQKEIRKEQVECWKDVTNVMFRLLDTWEAYQEARATSNFLRE